MPQEWVALSKEVGLVWFFLTFIAIIAWAYWPSNKKELEDQARVPMDDDDEMNPNKTS
uniref:Putative Cytochrome c oxidase, Cbb3-type, subunit Q (CcoQ) n=1 Tax=Magnetococcus massalia (strain MO-1) TaxID=451514 RepID=A0A1S7LI30_MAGMO|nr:putative Cytochrome c oxidase, Cbb3-type, subunit Q (ccoQ) [Candidatus Magnetococcus massalia]